MAKPFEINLGTMSHPKEKDWKQKYLNKYGRLFKLLDSKFQGKQNIGLLEDVESFIQETIDQELAQRDRELEEFMINPYYLSTEKEPNLLVFEENSKHRGYNSALGDLKRFMEGIINNSTKTHGE